MKSNLRLVWYDPRKRNRANKYKNCSKTEWLDICDGRSSEIIQKQSKIGNRATNGRIKVGVQELDVIHTKGLIMTLTMRPQCERKRFIKPTVL